MTYEDEKKKVRIEVEMENGEMAKKVYKQAIESIEGKPVETIKKIVKIPVVPEPEPTPIKPVAPIHEVRRMIKELRGRGPGNFRYPNVIKRAVLNEIRKNPTLPDIRISERFGLNNKTVGKWRKRAGLPKGKRRRWIPEKKYRPKKKYHYEYKPVPIPPVDFADKVREARECRKQGIIFTYPTHVKDYTLSLLRSDPGSSSASISRKTGISITTVENWRDSAGMPGPEKRRMIRRIRKRKRMREGRRETYGTLVKSDLIELAQQNPDATIEYLRRRFKIKTRETVYGWLKDHGLHKRKWGVGQPTERPVRKYGAIRPQLINAAKEHPEWSCEKLQGMFEVKSITSVREWLKSDGLYEGRPFTEYGYRAKQLKKMQKLPPLVPSLPPQIARKGGKQIYFKEVLPRTINLIKKIILSSKVPKEHLTRDVYKAVYGEYPPSGYTSKPRLYSLVKDRYFPINLAQNKLLREGKIEQAGKQRNFIIWRKLVEIDEELPEGIKVFKDVPVDDKIIIDLLKQRAMDGELSFRRDKNVLGFKSLRSPDDKWFKCITEIAKKCKKYVSSIRTVTWEPQTAGLLFTVKKGLE